MNFKQFLSSFLGSLAALWVSGLILGALMFVSLISLVVAGASGSVTKVEKHSVLHIDLSDEIAEYARPRNLIDEIQNGASGAIVLNDLIRAIDRAADDNRIEGIFIDCNGASAGLARLQALYNALRRFKKNAPDKWIYAYGDVISQGDYILAATADSLFINPLGIVDIHGLSSQGLYFKNLLDKLGVDMQVVKVGTYKSAVEPYILNGPSEAATEQTRLFLDNMWGEVVRMISIGRGVPGGTVNCWADAMCMSKDAKYYTDTRIADAALYRHEVIDRLKERCKTDDLRLVEVNDYVANLELPKSGSARIAVYYACGEIFDSGKEGISAEAMVPDILELAEDKNIDALILRVNSPGGSAFASEQIWEAIGEFKAVTGKPVYVSMSDYAASGGYYISCGADKIYAEPTTLTGSIGIFGVFPDMHNLITDKIGINVVTTSTNPQGSLPTIFEPMTPTQRTALQAYVNRGYELFVKRVAEGRNMSVDSVKVIAEGRVWDGAEAKKRGLVDKLGGLDAAIADLAAELNADSWRVEEYPVINRKWWEDIVNTGFDDIEARIARHSLGDAAPLYDALRMLRGMSPVQARMDISLITP